MFKKFLAVVTTLALSLGMVALTAGPASAHHNTIAATVSCNTGTEGSWKVTWTIKNSESIAETITASSDTSIVAKDTVINGGQTLTVVKYFTTKPASDFKLTLSSKWTNNQTATNDGWLYKNDFKDNCLPDTTSTKVDICHANNGNGTGGWVTQNVSYKSIVEQNGHGVHQNGRDIIPPFAYIEAGVAKSFAGLNWTAFGQWVLSHGCSTGLTPDVPQFTDAVCTADKVPGTTGQYFIPNTNTDKIAYYVAITNTGQTPADNSGSWQLATTKGVWVNVAVGKYVHVRAEGVNGYDTTGTDTWKRQIGAPTVSDCLTDVAPKKPEISQAVCVANDDAKGSYTIPTIAGLEFRVFNSGTNQWEVKAPGVYPAEDGTTVSVRVYATNGFELTDTEWQKDYKEYSLQFNGYDDSKCQVATAPDQDVSECTTPGQSSTARFFVPTDAGVVYKVYVNDVLVPTVAGWNDVTGLPKTVKIVATAAPGNVIVPNSVTEWTYAFASAGDCLVDATPVEPTWTDSICNVRTTGSSQAGFVVNGTPGDHVSYLVSYNGVDYVAIADGPHDVSVGTTVWIKAVADAGYQLKNDSGPWSHTFVSPGDCLDEVTPGQVTSTQPQCTPTNPGVPSQGGYTLPAVIPAGVVYTVTVNGADSVGTAGFHPLAVGDKVTVVASAATGYKLAAGTWTWGEWTIVAPAEPNADCLYAAPVDPIVHSDQACVIDDFETGAAHYVPGTITIPSTPHVIYSVDGIVKAAGPHEYAPGVYAISAEADFGYQLTGVPDPWKVEVAKAKPCGQLETKGDVTPVVSRVQTTCSASGSYTLGVMVDDDPAGVIWTVSGGLPNTLGTHTVTTAGTVTITATAAPGFGLSGDQDGIKEWSYDFVTFPADCLPTLALTGGPVAAGGLGLTALLTLGGILLLAARKRDVFEH